MILWRARRHSGDTRATRITRDTSFFSFPFGEILQILPSEPSLDYVPERYTVGFHRLEVYLFHVGSELLLQPLDQSLMTFFRTDYLSRRTY